MAAIRAECTTRPQSQCIRSVGSAGESSLPDIHSLSSLSSIKLSSVVHERDGCVRQKSPCTLRCGAVQGG